MKGKRCQSFTLMLDDGDIVTGRGQFAGPITELDRQALIAVVRALKELTHAESIDYLTLTKVK